MIYQTHPLHRLNCHSFTKLFMISALFTYPVIAQESTENQATKKVIANVYDEALIEKITVYGRKYGYSSISSASATRTDTSLLEVPQSIQIISRDVIRDQDSRTLADALSNVSGVVANKPEEGLLTTPIVRGFPAEIYQDGLPMYSSPSAVNDPTSLVGISRIEVLKGPNSTLYGGGVGTPLGGIINIETQKPTDTFGGFAAVRTGSFSTVNPYGEINIPFSSNIAANISAEHLRNDSWIDQVKGERWFIQPSIAFKLSSQTDLLVQGQMSKRSQLEYSGIPAKQAFAGDVERNAFVGAPLGQPKSASKNKLLTSTLQHLFDDDTKLTITGRHFNSESPQFGSFVFPDMYPADSLSPTIYPILTHNMFTKTRGNTLDTNLSAVSNIMGGQHKFLFGLNFDSNRFNSNMGFAGIPVGNLDLAKPKYNLSFGELAPLLLTQTDHYKTTAVYIQDQANYGRWHLTAALRYTELEFKEMEQATDETYRKLSPRFGATFDMLPGVALYASYAKSFRGAFGLVSIQTPKPETSRNIESGLKFSLPSSGLSGSFAVFEQERNNVATPDPQNIMFSIQTGQQRARGSGFDFIWEPNTTLSVIGNFAHTKAEVTKDSFIPAGDKLARVPLNRGRLAARYRFQQKTLAGLSIGVGVTAFNSRELTLPNSIQVPGAAIIDTQVSYDIEKFTVFLSVANLFNHDFYETYQYFGFPVVMPIQPRSAYVSFVTKF